MANYRIFYAVQSVGVAKDGFQAFTAIRGLQSIGVNTKFNLEQYFEEGQMALYAHLEGVPDVEITMEKVLDGDPLIYHLATQQGSAASLVGRSTAKCIVGLSLFPDTSLSASGTAVAQCQMSGVYVSSLNYNVQVQGAVTEQVTLVGNSKVWNQSFTAPTFDNTDTPSASEGVERRQDILFGSAQSLLPTAIPGISASGTNDVGTQGYAAHLQSIKVSANLGREALYELGTKAVYCRYVNFPVEVRSDFELIAITGDNVAANPTATNLTAQTIKLVFREGTTINLGANNKLTSVSHAGGNASQGGGNVSHTFSFVTYNDLTVTATHDPSALS